MLPIEGQPILTAAQMRAAEAAAARTPDAMYALMERAGRGVAEVVRRLAAGAEVLILCGPGNNGGDGYVAAQVLAMAGSTVRVAAAGEPATALARRARAGWTGDVQSLADAAPAPVLVDALFGTGLTRPLSDDLLEQFDLLRGGPQLAIAVDLPSGIEADTGLYLGDWSGPRFDLTLALGALKPAHVLLPAAQNCGAVRLIDLKVSSTDPFSPLHIPGGDKVIERPCLAPPRADSHKYSRGMAVVIGGAMPGAAALTVTAAMRAGAGYGLLLNREPTGGLPHAVVQRRWSADALADAVTGKRQVTVVVGPGLARDLKAKAQLEVAVACDASLVIDGDGLHLLRERHFARFRDRAQPVVLTPHAGEFLALFGSFAGSKIEATRAAARRSGATVVFKGADTVVAHPNGRARALFGASPWLSTAGTGDVLAGAIAGCGCFDGVEAGVWLHAEAARRCGASFIADDLAAALTPARASLCR